MLQVKSELLDGWFKNSGAYVLVDGQFGSTGKGAMAALLAELFPTQIDVITTNAGPNSGHTGYSLDGIKVVTRQIPVSSVILQLNSRRNLTYLNAGAIIDPVVLDQEIEEFNLKYNQVLINRQAAVISEKDKLDETTGTVARIATTGKGVGAALARKISRDPQAVVSGLPYGSLPIFVKRVDGIDWTDKRVFVETAQGFSLGIHSWSYPYTTSRECTVMQALADARIPAQFLRKVVMTVRTYPIRVGNTSDGNSGPWYSDQKEISWEDLGVEPELTTVTQRVRRVFTWSDIQFMEALEANRPDVIFVSFMDYFKKDGDKEVEFLRNLTRCYLKVMRTPPEAILLGYGPKPQDVRPAHLTINGGR